MAIGDGPLGVGLADDVAVELGDDFARGQILHESSSITMLRLV